MSRIAPEQLDRLLAAVNSHDFLHRLVREIEKNQRIVFHANERADWSRTRRSAEQILIAEIALRHRGNFDGVYFALRALEDAGQSWADAISALAASIHSYFTTPLGIIMRRDLFGEQVVFLSPDAHSLIESASGAAGKCSKSP